MYFVVSEFSSQLQRESTKQEDPKISISTTKYCSCMGLGAALPSSAYACVKWGEMPVWGQKD